MTPSEFCPECNAPLDFDEIDIGVGVQRGNYRCPDCGWAPPAATDLLVETTDGEFEKVADIQPIDLEKIREIIEDD